MATSTSAEKSRTFVFIVYYFSQNNGATRQRTPLAKGGYGGIGKTLNPKKVYFGGKGWDLPLTEVRAAWALWARRAPLPWHTLNPKP